MIICDLTLVSSLKLELFVFLGAGASVLWLAFPLLLLQRAGNGGGGEEERSEQRLEILYRVQFRRNALEPITLYPFRIRHHVNIHNNPEKFVSS